MKKRLAYLFAATVLVSTSLFAHFTNSTTQALSGADFKADRIVDDAVFYNANAMNVDQIQSFLNAKMPNCDTNGTKNSNHWNTGAGRYYTRAEWGAQNGNYAPYNCLKDYRQDMPTIPADSYCKRSEGTNYLSAANIIDRVSKACGINPQVLLVLLQKEQGLLTDEWPWQQQYNAATGFACPDTAPCDEQFRGFFNQVYRAARQFQIYTKLSSSFNYRSNRQSYIQYNPSASCGGSNVYIQNQATANLYNYTPYQPNGAALANLQGTGDNCSAYGNRNFWMYFNSWFGSPITTTSSIRQPSAQNRVQTVTTDTETYVFYYDAFQQNIRVSTRNLSSGSWTHAVLDGSSATGGGRIDANIGSSIAATRFGNYVQLFYYDQTNGNLRHAWTDSTGWKFENLDGDRGSVGKRDGDVGVNPSILIYNNNIQLFYYDSDQGNLRHAWTDSTGWKFENLDGDRGSVGRYDSNIGLTSSVLNLGGSIQLFYYDSDQGNLRHAWTDSTGWKFENLDGDRGSVSRTTGNVGMKPTLIEYNNNIQLFYYDSDQGNLRHAWTDSTGWKFENLDGDRGSVAKYSGNVGSNTSVTTFGNSIQLFYYDTDQAKLRHAWVTPGNNWSFENFDGDVGSIAGETGKMGLNVTAVGRSTMMDVFYYNQASGALKRAWADNGGWHFENISQSVIY